MPRRRGYRGFEFGVILLQVLVFALLAIEFLLGLDQPSLSLFVAFLARGPAGREGFVLLLDGGHPGQEFPVFGLELEVVLFQAGQFWIRGFFVAPSTCAER